MNDLDPIAWAKVKKWTEAELAKARSKNDAVGLNKSETAAIRGEIRLLKRILDLPNQATRNVEAPLDQY